MKFSNFLKTVLHMTISETGTEKVSNWTGKTQKICKNDLMGNHDKILN